MRKLTPVLLGLIFAFVTACGGGGGGGTGPADDDDDGNGNGGGNGGASVAAEITMDDLAYIDPQGNRNMNASVTIQVDETVRWTNQDDVEHTVTSGEGTGGTDGDGLPEGVSEGMTSGSIGPGGTFSFTFDTPGTWTYYCEIHPGTMFSATIIVEE